LTREKRQQIRPEIFGFWDYVCIFRAFFAIFQTGKYVKSWKKPLVSFALFLVLGSSAFGTRSFRDRRARESTRSRARSAHSRRLRLGEVI
jgi:hypothetical protein